MATKKKADIITSSGFSCSMDISRLDNMELIDALTVFEEGKSGSAKALSKALTLILGDDKQRLYDHLRTEDGRVPLVDLARELNEIINGAKDGKNS